MSEIKKVQCPNCKKNVKFEKKSTGKWVGTIAGGGLGYMLTSGLGIAGGILGLPVAIPAALVGLGIFALAGNRIGDSFDKTKVKCPNCGETLTI